MTPNTTPKPGGTWRLIWTLPAVTEHPQDEAHNAAHGLHCIAHRGLIYIYQRIR